MLLSVQDLEVSFRIDRRVVVPAVRGVSFDVPENTTVALVGESSVARLLAAPTLHKRLAERFENVDIINAGFVDEDFDARLIFVIPAAFGIINTHQCFDIRKQIAFRQKFADDFADHRCTA